MCVYMFTVCTCTFWFPHPPLPCPEGTIPASVSTCRPGQLCLLSFLAPSVLATYVHLEKQTANVGVLQAVGVVCAKPFSLSLLPGHPHTFKNTNHTLQDPSRRTNTSLSQNHFMNSVLAQFEQRIVLTLFFGS